MVLFFSLSFMCTLFRAFSSSLKAYRSVFYFSGKKLALVCVCLKGLHMNLNRIHGKKDSFSASVEFSFLSQYLISEP